MDGDDWSTLRRELGRVPGAVPDSAGMAVIDLVKWSDCVELYGRHFKPVFPVTLVHLPSFWASNPSPLLAGVMVGIGSQYDPRPNSKKYSMALLEASSKILNKREHTTGQSRLVDLQTVFLLEALNKFGSRRVNIDTSSRFRFLYASLAQARHWVLTSPLAVLKSLKSSYTTPEIKRAHSFWVDHETRRRILQACFVLDAFQSILFGQAPVLVNPNGSQNRGANGQGDMPFPCSSKLWESTPGQQWCDLAAGSVNDNVTVRDATRIALSPEARSLDLFQMLLVLSQILMHHRHLDSFSLDLDTFHSNIPLYVQGCPSNLPLVELTYHAVLAAHYTPVRMLLMVSGESWLLGRKIEDENEFREAKATLRNWIDAGSVGQPNSDLADVHKAVWHATRLLTLALGSSEINSYDPQILAQACQKTSQLNGHTHSGHDQALLDGIPPPLHLLYEPWSIYLCSLICWAYGLDAAASADASAATASSRTSVSSTSTTSSSGSFPSSVSSHPTLMPPSVAFAEARTYLGEMTSQDLPSPQYLQKVDLEVRGKTDGLLEAVRTTKLFSGDSGLMNDAERVLFRLVEKRGRGWAF